MSSDINRYTIADLPSKVRLDEEDRFEIERADGTDASITMFNTDQISIKFSPTQSLGHFDADVQIQSAFTPSVKFRSTVEESISMWAHMPPGLKRFDPDYALWYHFTTNSSGAPPAGQYFLRHRFDIIDGGGYNLITSPNGFTYTSSLSPSTAGFLLRRDVVSFQSASAPIFPNYSNEAIAVFKVWRDVASTLDVQTLPMHLVGVKIVANVYLE